MIVLFLREVGRTCLDCLLLQRCCINEKEANEFPGNYLYLILIGRKRSFQVMKHIWRARPSSATAAKIQICGEIALRDVRCLCDSVLSIDRHLQSTITLAHHFTTHLATAHNILRFTHPKRNQHASRRGSRSCTLVNPPQQQHQYKGLTSPSSSTNASPTSPSLPIDQLSLESTPHYQPSVKHVLCD